MIDPGTAQRSPNAGRSREKLRLRHVAAPANPRSGLSALPGVLERSKIAFGRRHPGNLCRTMPAEPETKQECVS
jgi:hypothetical protein